MGPALSQASCAITLPSPPALLLLMARLSPPRTSPAWSHFHMSAPVSPSLSPLSLSSHLQYHCPWETFPHLSGLSRCSEDLCFLPHGIYHTILSNYLFSPLSFFSVLTTGTRSGSFPPVNAGCMCWWGSLVRTGGKEFSWPEIPTESSYWSRPGFLAWSRLLLK